MATQKLYIHPNKLDEIRTLCPYSFKNGATSNTPTNSGIVIGAVYKRSDTSYNADYVTYGYGEGTNDFLKKADDSVDRIACYLTNVDTEVVDGVVMPYIIYDDESFIMNGRVGISIANSSENNNSNLQQIPIDNIYYNFVFGGEFDNLDSAIWTEPKTVRQGASSLDSITTFNHSVDNDVLSSLVIDALIPIFVDEESAREYIATGNVLAGKCFNLDNMMLSESTQHMISTRTYEYDQDKNCTGQDNETHVLYLRTFTGQKVSAYVADDKSKYNIRINLTQGSSNIDTVQYRVGAGSFQTVTIDEFNNSQYAKGFNTWKDFKPYGISGFVKGNLWRCTFDVFANKTDSDLWNNPITHDQVTPLNFDKDCNPINMSDTGTPATSESDLNDDYKDGTQGVVTLWELTKAHLAIIGNKLFTAGTDILDAFKIFGDSPINAVVSLYHCPIDISSMCELIADSEVKLGLTTVTCNGAQYVARYGKLLTLGSIVVNPFYNDFRDYNNFSFELHLPFSSPISLDARDIMNKTLTIKATCDAYAMQMRYYICIDGIVTQTVDCSFGHQVAIMGNDYAGKMKEVRQDIFATATTAINIATGTVTQSESKNQVATNIDLAGASSGVGQIMGSLENLGKEPAKTMVGNFASGCAECDVLYPYLSITETVSIKPADLEATYGRPSNFIGRIGNVHGFTIANMTRLEADCTSSERDEIINLLQGGIIV